MSLPVSSSKFGKVDRGWRPRGSLLEPGADEEQPMGGERKMHPSLEETIPPCHDLSTSTTLTNTHLQMTPLNLTPPPACEGHGRTAPPNLSPWMYNSWYPPTFPEHAPQQGHRNTHTHTDTYKDTHSLTLSQNFGATHSLQVYSCHGKTSLLWYGDNDKYSYYYMDTWRFIYAAASHKLLSSFALQSEHSGFYFFHSW